MTHDEAAIKAAVLEAFNAQTLEFARDTQRVGDALMAAMDTAGLDADALNPVEKSLFTAGFFMALALVAVGQREDV